MKRTILVLIAMLMIGGCSASVPTAVPTPVSTPSATPTPLPLATCMQDATASCTKTAGGDQAAYAACMAIRTNTCNALN